MGTNAIGTVLVTRQPVQLYGGEHFCEGIKGWMRKCRTRFGLRRSPVSSSIFAIASLVVAGGCSRKTTCTAAQYTKQFLYLKSHFLNTDLSSLGRF